jgi:C4-dicarboxylate-specific signal transduction histidine kinase
MDIDLRAVGFIAAAALVQALLIGALIIQRQRRRRAEQSLESSEERFSLATLPGNLGFWQWDARTGAIWASENFRDIMDVGAGVPLTADVIRARLHADDVERFEETFCCTKSVEGVDSDFRIQHNDGSTRWLTVKARTRREASGLVVRVTGVVIDNTERMIADLELQKQRLQLAHLTRVAILGQLSGALAHELTQPLTAILSNAQAGQRLLGASRPDGREIRLIFDDIVKNDKRAGEVIGRLRDMLKRGELQIQKLDIEQLIREMLNLARGELAARSVEIDIDVQDDLPMVKGDRVQLQQVLLNLLMNAAEAMAANPPRERRVRVGVVRRGTAVCTTVSDCGPGIPSHQLETVFDAFYTTKDNGLGLGLSICRSIITAHGGRLWATNNVPRGSSFHFTIPAAIQETEVAVQNEAVMKMRAPP